MMYNEFVERTGVQISMEEYWDVNEMYNDCTMSKDEFCEWWCKNNSERVAEAEAKRKAIEERKKMQAKALDIMIRLDKKLWLKPCWKPIEPYLGKRMKAFLDEQGIRYKDGVQIQTVMHRLNLIVRGM